MRHHEGRLSNQQTDEGSLAAEKLKQTKTRAKESRTDVGEYKKGEVTAVFFATETGAEGTTEKAANARG